VLIANARIPTSFKSPQLYKGDESEVTMVFYSLTIIQDNLHVPVINNRVENDDIKNKKSILAYVTLELFTHHVRG